MISEIGRSYLDSKQIDKKIPLGPEAYYDLGKEIMKLRRLMKGKQVEYEQMAQFFKKDALSFGVKVDAGFDKEFAKLKQEASLYGLFARHLDEVLHSCGIEVSDEYKLKRELKESVES